MDYSDEETQTESAAYLTMAGTTKLAADVQGGLSAVFLLYDPAGFEESTGTLRYLDGSLPEPGSDATGIELMASTSNADRWICDFYDTAGGRQRGRASGTGGSNASAGMVHIRCQTRIARLWNCLNKSNALIVERIRKSSRL